MALNVPLNQRALDELGVQRVFVPPAPNDCGLALGGAWAAVSDRGPAASQPRSLPLQYAGFELWDGGAESLENAARARGAVSLSALGGVEYLADLLAGRNQDAKTSNQACTLEIVQNENATCSVRPIVAIVRGRQEFGPRALGHRSLVAVPDSDEVRDRMNRLKARQWYRPVAPMVAEEELDWV